MPTAPTAPTAPTPTLAPQLHAGLSAMGVDLAGDSQARLLEFVALLEKWNRVYNLTAVREPAQMVTRHLLDSLAIAPYVCGERVLDVGTGAGLPGIPLAVAMPTREFVLLDSNSKKTRFVTQAVAELGLRNVEVVAARVERYVPARKFDTLIARAFSSLGELLTGARHLGAKDGVYLAMKGVYPEEELTALPAEFTVREIAALKVPGLDGARHVVVIGAAPMQL